MLLDLGPGIRSLVPSFGFVDHRPAFSRQGPGLLLPTSRESTLGLDPRDLAELMDRPGPRRCADPLRRGGLRHRRHPGVLADWPRASWSRTTPTVSSARDGVVPRQLRPLSTLSFHETKNFICGEGGALVIDRAEDIDRTHVLYNKGTNRQAFLLGHVDKYSWQDIGSSFGLADVLAAFLYGQLQQARLDPRHSGGVFDRYGCSHRMPRASGTAARGSRPAAEQAYHMFYVLIPPRPSHQGPGC